jgi:hypothetical protein
MITIQLTINGTNLSNFIKYPVNYTNKNLDESLNLLDLTLFATNIETPFKPNTIANIVISDGGVNYLNGQMVISGDTIERVGVTNKYHHKISLIELTYLLSLEILPDMTITRVSVVGENQSGSIYEPTLADVMDKILKYSEGTFSKTLTVGAATRNILAAIDAPELTFTRYTTLEALRLVFGIAKIVPYCLVEGFLNHVSVTSNTTTEFNNYVAKSEAYNTEQFRTKLYSPVENFIGGGDLAGSIVEPVHRGWITPRSIGSTDINSDSAVLKLNRPIYKVEKLSVIPYAYISKSQPGQTTTSHRVVFVPLDTIPNASLWFNGLVEIEITERLFEKSRYDLLPNTDEGKGSAVYYEQGKNEILGLSNIPETWSSFWAPQDQAIRQILRDKFNGTTTPTVLPQYATDFENYMKDRFNSLYPNFIGAWGIAGLVGGDLFGTTNSIGTKDITKSGITGSALTLKPLSQNQDSSIIHTGRFRVTYTPYINTKLITYKERKETGDPVHETTMFYNQSANTIADETLAELHDKVIKRGNAPTQTIKKLHSSLNTIPNLGRLAGNYVLTAQDIQFLPDHANVEHVLSKDYAKLNQYVAVLEKYRQFSIPSERVVDRQIIINEFAKFSRAQETKTASITISSYMGTNEANIMTINTSGSFWFPEEAGPTLSPVMAFSTTNFAFNNALVFEISMQSNSSAGSQSDEYYDQNGTLQTNRRIEKPIPYVDNVGYFQNITQLTLGTNIGSSMSLNDSYEYPIFTNEILSNTFLTKNNIPVDKDAREKLSISYILHHIDETQKVYINRGWALRNGLIGGPGYSGLRFAYFNTRPREGVTNISNYGAVGTFPNVFVQNIANVRIGISHFVSSVPTSNYWGIIDENNELLFWVNEPCVAGVAPATLYINFRSTY